MNRDDEMVARMLRARRIAVVGLSDDPSRPSHGVASYLQSQGCEIFPVNPNCKTALGVRCYASLSEVPGPVDLVNVFRRAEFCADIVHEAIAIGAAGIWLQSGIVNEDAKRRAIAASLDFVQNRCLMIEHMQRGAG